MLALPIKGIARSIQEHNIKLDTFCDWIEGSVLFDGEGLSSSDIVDILIEGQIYDDQDFASEIVDSAWAEIHLRQSWLGATNTLSISARRIEPQDVWQNLPAHSFCSLVSLATYYTGWSRQFGQDYNEQGELFELLTKESIESQFPDWKVYQTGWTRVNAVDLKTVVDKIANLLGENPGDLEIWADPEANESGLDLLCYRPFTDNRVGFPVYLMQCASGGNWTRKIHTPDLKVWTKVVQFAATPRKAFAVPFALLDDVFLRSCNKVDGMLLDRYRLLTASTYNSNWVSSPLKDRIISWLEPRIAELPRAET